MYSLQLEDDDNNVLWLADVESIDAGRALWCRVAGGYSNSRLIGYTIWADEGNWPVYSGNYVTDEC